MTRPAYSPPKHRHRTSLQAMFLRQLDLHEFARLFEAENMTLEQLMGCTAADLMVRRVAYLFNAASSLVTTLAHWLSSCQLSSVASSLASSLATTLAPWLASCQLSPVASPLACPYDTRPFSCQFSCSLQLASWFPNLTLTSHPSPHCRSLHLASYFLSSGLTSLPAPRPAALMR